MGRRLLDDARYHVPYKGLSFAVGEFLVSTRARAYGFFFHML